MNYLLFDLVNILGILIWSLGHNVWNFYLRFRTFKLELCYCFVPLSLAHLKLCKIILPLKKEVFGTRNINLENSF